MGRLHSCHKMFSQGRGRGGPCKNFPLDYFYHHAQFSYCFLERVHAFGGRWGPAT